MKVLVLGATGYIGSAVTDALERGGHEVVALTRTATGALNERVGDLTHPASLTGAVTRDIDAVIHLATPTGDFAVDAAAIEALAAPLRGTGRAFVYASGVWVLGATGPRPAVEDAPYNPIPLVGYRPRIEQQVLAASAEDVRAAVVRPGIVHGRGGGIPALLVELARQNDGPMFVGAETTRWPMVHVDDLADLFRLVVEHAPAGTIWHGVAESAVPVQELAAAAGRAVGIFTAPRSLAIDAAREALGADFADALALDQAASGDAARVRLGWDPRRPGVVADLVTGSYAQAEDAWRV
jgi:nucleoside-diphosphate-sugar epimerase